LHASPRRPDDQRCSTPARRAPARQLLAGVAVVALIVVGSPLPSVDAGAASEASATQQLGFNSYVQDLCQSSAIWASDAVGQFTELKSLGANSIALAFPIYMSEITSSSVFPKRTCGTIYQTPSPARLAIAIKEAHALGLRVFLRPMVEELTLRDSPGGWRGLIRPKHVGPWFKSYLAVLTPYLELAQRLKVEYFAISTELDSLSRKPNWASVIKTAKQYYKGPLIFTVPWHPGQVTHAGTSPGLDAYQGILAPDSATPSQLLAGWNYAATTSDPLPFPLSAASIDEVAIPAQDGAYPTPWVSSLPLSTNPFDQSIQANWYSMACSFFRLHKMRGIYFWGIFYDNGADAVLTTPGPGLTQEIQPASVAVIKQCYTGT
jgi:glycosyl hydrolase family 113